MVGWAKMGQSRAIVPTCQIMMDIIRYIAGWLLSRIRTSIEFKMVGEKGMALVDARTE